MGALATGAKVTKVGGHGERAHSKIGPSGWDRWSSCAVSVPRSRGIPNKDSVFAREGTAAHEMCEFLLVSRFEPSRFLGGVVRLDQKGTANRILEKHAAKHFLPADRENVFEIDQEMIDAYELYRDTIDAYRCADWVVKLEMRLNMQHIHPELFGTADCLIYLPRQRKLVVTDFKYGEHHVVEVIDEDDEPNGQVATYAVGAVHEFQKLGYRIDTVELVIVQPRAFHLDGPVRKLTLDIIDLMTFEARLLEATRRTDDPNAVATVGPHCRYCPVSYACAELQSTVLETVGATVENGVLVSMPDPKKIDLDAIGEVVMQAYIVQSWIKAVLQRGHELAMNGKIPTGCKLVAKKAYRKFTSDEDDVILELDLAGVPEHQYMTDPQPELKSVAQLEKAIGKAKMTKVLGPHFRAISNGSVLAPLDDSRVAIKHSTFEIGAAADDDY